MASRISGCASSLCCATCAGERKGGGSGSKRRTRQRCPRRSRRFSGACAKQRVEPVEPRGGIGELEQLLLRRQREGQKLGEASADPRNPMQPMQRRGPARGLLEYALEKH